MAYPQILSQVTGSDGSSVTTHNITLPTGIREGDIIYIVAATNVSSFDWVDDNSDGYIGQSSFETDQGIAAWFKIASGSESGETVQFTVGSAADWAWSSFRIGDPNEIKRTRNIGWMRDSITSNTPNIWPAFNSSVARDVLVVANQGVASGITLSTTMSGFSHYSTNGSTGATVIVQQYSSSAAAFEEISQGSMTLSSTTNGWNHTNIFAFIDDYENYHQEPGYATWPQRYTTDQYWYAQQSMNDTNFGIAQSFRAGGGLLKRAVAGFLKENAAQTSGTITAKLYTAAGTMGRTSATNIPTGSALATSSPVNISDIIVSLSTFSHYAGVEFNFDTPYETVLNNDYCIAFEISGNGTTYSVYAIKAAVSNDVGNIATSNGTWTDISEDLQIQLYMQSGSAPSYPSLVGVGGARKNFMVS